MKISRFLLPLLIAYCAFSDVHAQNSLPPSSYVDPKIGSVGLGRVCIAPSMPFGMIKPSPDGVSMPNAGWAEMPEPIKGFSQVHVSGTGGGQKYGNILVMPFIGETDNPRELQAARTDETIELGYYATTFEEGISTEITTANKAAIYRFDYPAGAEASLAIDCGWYLGLSPEPDGRETQQFVGSEIEVVSPTEVRGYSRVRGGWNNGRAYTVYFYAIADRPAESFRTWKGDKIGFAKSQSDTHQPTGAILNFGTADKVTFKIGISFLSSLKAKENLIAEIPAWDFDGTRQRLLASWDKLLGKITIDENASDKLKRMFYTGLYHTMIMPVDRSGENPLWADDSPYYDDFYALWDTYRTSSPLITIIDEKRQVDIVNSLLNIYKRDGYMPDARSGDSNGRTQGGSNAEIVIADAFVKGLKGIDYEYALDAMLKDADVPPGGNEEAEGRGGLVEYKQLGYIPYGIPRAGNRTVEYSFCDYAIATVAAGLGGHDDTAERMFRRSSNWKNLWRRGYEHAGTHGFIMPRDADGVWLDSLPQGHSKVYSPKFKYTPMTFEGPWYDLWWSMFFYEAPSWEYSLSIPHDVNGLVDICGGKEPFEKRLDTFFDRGFYNVNNEPSFLSPCLYHWIGKPSRSSDRIREIVAEHFNDSPQGLPGNDDSGAMSSWLAFHIIGLYPNAGTDYYLINSPMVESTTFRLSNGKRFTIQANNLSEKNRYIRSAKLNGKPYNYSFLFHSDLMQGGTLELEMGSKPSKWGSKGAIPDAAYYGLEFDVAGNFKHGETLPANAAQTSAPGITAPGGNFDPAKLRFVFKLHGQTRRYNFSFVPQADGSIVLTWGIERNLKWQQGTYTMLPSSVKNGRYLDFSMPMDGVNAILPAATTAYILSETAYTDLKEKGSATINNAQYSVVSTANGFIEAHDDLEGATIWVLDKKEMPIIWKMTGNPLEVDWTVNQL